MTNHLGYEKNEDRPRNSKNYRNGSISKTLKLGEGELEINVPRDRNSEFEPILVPKRQRIISGLDEKVISAFSLGTDISIERTNELKTLFLREIA